MERDAMKKSFGLALAALMAASLTACGGDDDTAAPSETTAASTTEPTETAETAETTETTEPTESTPTGPPDPFGGDYCEVLQEAKTEFADFGGGDIDQTSFEDLEAKIGELEDAAPEEVSGDWMVLGDGISGFLQVLEDAGITLDDLAAFQRGEVPEGVDPQVIQELPQKIQALGLDGPEFQRATEAIEGHAKSECGVDLGAE